MWPAHVQSIQGLLIAASYATIAQQHSNLGKRSPLKSRISLAVAAFAAMVPALVVVSAGPASAACQAAGTKTSTSTTSYAYTCYRAQPRITRYVGGSQGVVIYYGSWSTSSSTVFASNGTDAGHAVRGGDQAGGAIGPWGSF